jgi:hypothetical protein
MTAGTKKVQVVARDTCLKTLAKTTGFLLFAEPKPCDNRATEFGSTFSAANPMNMVAWSGIEPLTRGFSTHVAPKTSMFAGLAAGFRVTCYRPCYTKTTLFCSATANRIPLYHSCLQASIFVTLHRLLCVGLQFTTSKAQVLQRRKPQPNFLWIQAQLG